MNESKYHSTTNGLSSFTESSKTTSSSTSDHPFAQLKQRKPLKQSSDLSSSINDELDEIISKTSELSINNPSKWSSSSSLFINYLNPLFLTILSAIVRLYDINKSKAVTWDEAHFGKFGAYYLNHEFYFDVHPPLGKLLIGLSEYLSNFNGEFAFDSGAVYPEECDFVFMRVFNCIFSILCTPLSYYLGINLGFSQWTTWFLTLSVTFEMISLTLSKFILLDSILIFFTVLSYFCLIKLHNLIIQNNSLSLKGFIWLIVTGFSIGCVCSVKWVGLFVTVLVGLYIIYDLLIKSYQLTSKSTSGAPKISIMTYILHWISRIITLILIPFFIYLFCFKIHFTVLNRSGTGDGSISTLLQTSLEGNSIRSGPRSISYGSLITLRSQGLSPNLIHSHEHIYPEGSHQQQVTTYGFKDENNDFLIDTEQEINSSNDDEQYRTLVKDGDVIRLTHEVTGCLIRTHTFHAPVSNNHFEVSCFGDVENENEFKDEWIIEIQNHEVSPSPSFQNENADEIHPISTNFRLKNKQLGCYLATTGYSYPSWGFQQGEVVCKYTFLSKDKSTWWNIEDHVNNKLEMPAEAYVPPKPKFWKEFILLNYGMMASNNALVPDPDKFDRLSSEWWEWPILHTGLRMCSWLTDDVKFFLIGNPFITWFSTLSLGLFLIYALVKAFRYQRQLDNFDLFDSNWNLFLIQGIVPFIGWFFHYFPFIVMGRVKYLHHYLPAQYFAILISSFIMESLIQKKIKYKYLRYFVYASSYILIIGSFWYLKDLAFGMEGPSNQFSHLKLLPTWYI
ncbi:Dolichyl-phosphate-mannose-protein mannosyltransferase-domain-containing protein [Scheffersomyces coipomensis]|uniref:Dolichyl-phosphate-mannose-protein mannosyltransferase-domain-containing protein n=1 Tax=Scheffersomyces coipomensis TaxID=1788519 RepID=UPI00315DA792